MVTHFKSASHDLYILNIIKLSSDFVLHRIILKEQFYIVNIADFAREYIEFITIPYAY